MEVGKTFGTGRLEATAAASAGESRVRSTPHVSPYPDDEDPQGLAVAPARAPQTEAYLRAWIAADPASIRVLEQAARLAPKAGTILIRGERGTGKQLLATIIHHLGRTADAPLISVDCAAVAASALESELFGFERDGYVQRACVELAHGGTLVLNEVTALPRAAQERLLRVIEDHTFERLGSRREVRVDVRVIGISSVPLEVAVSGGSFHQDLAFALAMNTINVQALRSRPLDVRPLAEHFREQVVELHRKDQRSFSAGAFAALEAYSYPGNVTELRHIVEHAVTHGQGHEVVLQDLPPHVASCVSDSHSSLQSLEDVEREHITRVLQFTGGRKTETANLLGISRKTLLEKRKRYGLG